MNKELFVTSTPHETRVGMVEDDQLAEIYLERENEYTLAGSIYKGRVTRVLPGMQSAFVDIGLERDAFLYVSDFMELEDSDDMDDVPAQRSSQRNQIAVLVRQKAETQPADLGEEVIARRRTLQLPEGESELRTERPRASAEDSRGVSAVAEAVVESAMPESKLAGRRKSRTGSSREAPA